MKLFNRNTNPVPEMLIIDEADFYAHPFAREEEDQDNEHPGDYYCGICGWVPIEKFPYCH